MKQEIKFQPSIVSSFDEFKIDINNLLAILTEAKSEWFLYCQSFDHCDLQFLPVTYEEVYKSDNYNLYKQNASFNNFQIGVIQITENAEFNFTNLYSLLTVLKHKSNDFENGRR